MHRANTHMKLYGVKALFVILSAVSAMAQRTPFGSLKSVNPPAPSGEERYVKDRTALIALGKALFWDMQAGSDGRTACASCHFHAGADHRVRNQLAGATAAPNQALRSSDFPFHKLSNADDNRSAVLSDIRQVAGSAGVVERSFLGIRPDDGAEDGAATMKSPFFAVNGVHMRQVTGRNTPSVINAVFNVRNFWDGRARTMFTGATPFGESDPAQNAVAWREGKLVPESVVVGNSSLASQAVGPALNSVEMSWDGRTWPLLARKMLSLRPLARQTVSAEDSVLGALAATEGPGLREGVTYTGFIQAAFKSDYWSGPQEQMEKNFALFWGLAIQAYEATLVADDSRVDQFLDGRRDALTPLEQAGLQEFQGGNSQCTRCHTGPEATAAGWTSLLRRGLNTTSVSNAGFFRLGVTPIEQDPGLGAKDGLGNPLFVPARAGSDLGTFKAPGLRNVELTGPYFHDGSQATLEQVIDFYARNGDFPEGGNLGPGIGAIRLSAQDKTALVAFLKALTDDRVRYQRAPFDHPSLCIPDGHETDARGAPVPDAAQSGTAAADRWQLIQAVGKSGLAAPLRTFEELLNGTVPGALRANPLGAGCMP